MEHNSDILTRKKLLFGEFAMFSDELSNL